MSDVATLKVSLAGLEAALAATIAEKATILAAMALSDSSNPVIQDVISKSKSGDAGTTSFTYVSNTERFRTLASTEGDLISSIRQLKILIAQSSPGIYRSCY